MRVVVSGISSLVPGFSDIKMTVQNVVFHINFFISKSYHKSAELFFCFSAIYLCSVMVTLFFPIHGAIYVRYNENDIEGGYNLY